MMTPAAGQEILGLGGRLGSFSDRFELAAATKLRLVGLQSKEAQFSPNKGQLPPPRLWCGIDDTHPSPKA